MVAPKGSVFLFIGGDEYLKEKALKDLSSSLLGKSSDQSGQKTFYGGELDAQEVFDQLNTIPLLSDKRFIVIKDIEEAPVEFKASLIEYIKKPSPFAYLVMTSRDDSILGDYKRIAGQINVRQFGMTAGSSLVSWIKNFVSSNGKTIEDGALSILKELEGNDLSYLSQELDKLITFVGHRKEIKISDVEEVVGSSLITSAFGIADAVGRRDTAGAIKISSNLIAGGKKEQEIIGLLSWHLKRLLRAKVLKAGGQSDHVAAGILKLSHRFHNEFFRQLAGFDQEKIKSDIELLLQADLDIKSSRFNPNTILEFALIRLCLL